MKPVEKFLAYLEENELFKLNPNAFTNNEILVFAHSKGFNITKQSLQQKIAELSSKQGTLSRIEEKWVPTD